MKHIIILISLLLSQYISAQEHLWFAIVKDQDGWVNARDSEKNIIDRINNNELVYVYPSNNDQEWLDVDYVKKGQTKDGIIHRSRLYAINQLTKIPCSIKNLSYFIFKNDLYEIKVSIAPFDSINRNLEYAKEGNWLRKIDDRFPWGAEVGIPKSQYLSIEVKKNGKITSVPKEDLNDLFEPNLDNIDIYYDINTNTLYITSLNSDGAGGYIAAWTIENNKYKERLVTHGF